MPLPAEPTPTWRSTARRQLDMEESLEETSLVPANPPPPPEPLLLCPADTGISNVRHTFAPPRQSFGASGFHPFPRASIRGLGPVIDGEIHEIMHLPSRKGRWLVRGRGDLDPTTHRRCGPSGVPSNTPGLEPRNSAHLPPLICPSSHGLDCFVLFPIVPIANRVKIRSSVYRRRRLTC